MPMVLQQGLDFLPQHFVAVTGLFQERAAVLNGTQQGRVIEV